MTVHNRLALLLALPLALTASGQAQTQSNAQAPAAAAPAAAPASSDQPVQLSEFEVSDKAINGYTASETMSGSRINTKIVELPYSIVNLNSEFFNDFNIEILDENMTYIGGLTGVGIGGGFNLRGFSATSMLRDGFYRLGRYGLSNIDRVEIIRGPNAAIYGRSSPGGMVNFISLPPKKTDEQSVTISDGGYKQTKDNLYLTGSIDKDQKTYYVVDINQTARAYPGEFSEIRNSEYFGAIKHDFSSTSHLLLSAEYFLQVQHAPQTGAPILSVARTATPDNTATSTVVGYDWGLAQVTPYGPNSELNRGSHTFQAIYDNQFNDVWSTRLGLYRFMARRWDYNQNTGWGGITIPTAAGAAVTDTRGSLPSRGEIMEDGGGFQEDVVAHYFMFNRKVDAQSMLTVDLNDYYRWDPTWEYAVNGNADLQAWNASTSGRVVSLVPSVVNGRQTLMPSAPVTYFPKFYDPTQIVLFAPGGNAVTGGPALNGGSLTRRRTTSLGGNLKQKMTMLDGKLIVYAGLRNDSVLFSQRDYTVAFASVGFGNTLAAGTGGPNQPGGSVVRRYEHQNKPNYGFSYQAVPNIYLYGSYSTAYFVDQTSRPAVIASSTYAPFTAKGFDYGVKGTFLNQRLNMTIGGFYTQQFNVLVTDVTEISPGLFTDIPQQDGNQLVRGWETDVSYEAIPNELYFLESFGRVDSRYTYFGSAFPEVIGRSVNGITPENGSLTARYNFSHGPLQGLYMNLLTTYVASTPTQAPNSGDTATIVNGVSTITAHTDAWKLRLPSYELWNFGIHYHLPRFMGPKWDQTISLNVNNIFNKYYLKTNATLGDSRSILVQYQITHF